MISWFVGLILVATLLLFLAWIGVLGASAELKLKLLVDWALDFYDLNKEEIHRAIPWIGAGGSAIWAAVVFARAWHYADQTIPQRLEEFNKRTAKAVLSKRDDVLSFVTAGQQGTPASSNSWSFSSWLQHRSLRSYCTNLDSLSAELDTQLSMLSGTKLHRSIERATVHLALGLRIVRQADEEKTALLGDPLRKNARIQFRQAAELDPNAIWALQYAVDQSKKLGQDDEAAIDLDRLCKSKIEDRQRARALFLLAEILHRRGQAPIVKNG